VLRWLKTVVVSDAEKAHSMRQVGIRKTVRSPEDGIAVEVSLAESKGHQNRGVRRVSRDQPGGCPLIGRVVSGR
jgi:protein required for attachment to host cells